MESPIKFQSAKIFNGQDGSCDTPVRKYHQQAVIINLSDIDSITITEPDYVTPTCSYKVVFALKTGLKGFKFQGPEAGSNYFGSFDKSRNDLGYPQYKHNAQILVSGITEAAKCAIAGLDKGSFIVALQLKDGTVEIYGAINGLTTGDYTYDVQGGGGGTPILLTSLEDAP